MTILPVNKKANNGEDISVGEMCDQLFAASKTLATMIDAKGRCVYLSPNHSDLPNSEELTPVNWNNHIHPEDAKHLYQLVRSILSDPWMDDALYCEYRLRMGNEWLWFRADIQSTRRIREDHAMPTALILSHNITSFKKSHAVRQMEATHLAIEESRNHLLSHMNHELRTPLNAVIGFSELLMISQDKPERTREYAEMIRDSGQQLLQTAEQLVHLTKTSFYDSFVNEATHDLRDLLADIDISLGQSPRGKTPQIEFYQPSHAVWAFVDGIKIKQALSSLACFASDHIPANQPLAMRCYVQQDGTAAIECNLALNDNIENYAQALSDSNQQQFLAHDGKHSLLFLSIAAHLMRIHEGDIQLEETQNSRQGSNARITATLPASRILAAGKYYSGVLTRVA